MLPTIPKGALLAVDLAPRSLDRYMGQVVCVPVAEGVVVGLAGTVEGMGGGAKAAQDFLVSTTNPDAPRRVLVRLTTKPPPLLGVVVWFSIDLHKGTR
jgi:hypothetical protein